MKQFLFDGRKGIGLEQYPEESWLDLSPTGINSGRDSRDEVEAVHGYYDTVAWLYRCVEIRANAVMSIPWAIMRGDEEIWLSSEPMPPNTLLFLNKIKRLIWLTEAALCLSPEAFWFREKNRVRTINLKWHMAGSVLPVWDEVDGLIGFERIANGQKRRFAIDDYVYFPRPNPLHETKPGRPPAQAAMSAAGVIYSVNKFSTDFFGRGAIKATMLTVDGNPPESEMKRLESLWRKAFQGVKNSWTASAIRAGVTTQVIGEGLSELSNSELTREKKEDIATGLGVPHSLVFSNAANFATADKDTINFYDLTVIPEIELMFSAINEQLLESLGLVINHRANEMTVYQEDETSRGQAFSHYVSAGMRQSVAAQILGIDLPEGMEYKDLDEDPEPVTELTIVEPEPPPQLVDNQAIEQEKSRFRRWAKKRKNPDPDDFKSDFLGNTDKNSILYELGRELSEPARTIKQGPETVEDVLQTEEYQTFLPLFVSALTQQYSGGSFVPIDGIIDIAIWTGLLAAFARMGIGVIEHQMNEELTQGQSTDVEADIDTWSGHRVALLTGGTFDEDDIPISLDAPGVYYPLVEQSLDVQGEAEHQLIDGDAEARAESRGSLIAVTEALVALSFGQYLTGNLLGAQTKTWLPSTAKVPRAIHIAQYGVTVPFNDTFPDGSFWSQSLPNCQCGIELS